MRAKDVMTRRVHTVGEDATVFDAARLLLSASISAAPVVSADGTLVGIISEADLMRRADLGTEQKKSWFLRLLADDVAVAAEYIRSHARRAADVMTRDVVTADEDALLGEIASLMESNRVKRVPILKDGKVVGIVSRANLLQGLLAYQPTVEHSEVSDTQIRARVVGELERSLGSSASIRNVIVEHGVVHLWGLARSDTEVRACRVAAESVPGAKRVENHLKTIPSPMGDI